MLFYDNVPQVIFTVWAPQTDPRQYDRDTSPNTYYIKQKKKEKENMA